MRRTAIACAILCAFAAFASADHIVLKSGKVIRGRILDRVGGRIMVRVSRTITVELREEDVEQVVRSSGDVPTRLAPAPPEGTARPKGRANPGPRPRRRVVCFVQIEGALDSVLMSSEMRSAAARARRYGAEVVVIEIDTPGGRLDVMQEVIAAIEELAPMQTVAYVKGGADGGAFSAGAVVAVACGEIFMAPGTAIGAAAPIRVTKAGVSPVGEKTVSAVTAKVRSIAQKNGHPHEVVAAMVDADIELRMATVNGRDTYLSIKAGAEAPPAPKTHVGDWITKKGKLLTLTAVEAKRLGVASDVVADREELLATLGLNDARVINLNTTKGLKEAMERRDRYLLELNATIASYEAKARAIDPARFKYGRSDLKKGFLEKGDFLDEGRLWRRRTEACVSLLGRCLDACRKKLVLARKYPELHLSEAEIEKKMTDLLSVFERVRAERGRQGGEQGERR